MHKIMSALAAAVVLGAATLAFADSPAKKTTGKIKFVDMFNHAVTLEDGVTYKIARGVNIGRMRAGDKVTLTYTRSGPVIEASAIAPAVD